jgi:dTDP-D-glucose 4,6-dehydratase
MPSLLIQGTNRVLVIGIERLGPRGAAESQAGFRSYPISTDQVPGSSGPVGSFSETTPLRAAQPLLSKQERQRPLVRAWLHAFGLLLVILKAVCAEQSALYGGDHRERIGIAAAGV